MTVFISWSFAVSVMFVLLVALKISTKRASFVGFVGWLNSLTARYRLQIQYQNEFQTSKPHTNAHRHETRTQKTSSILIKHFLRRCLSRCEASDWLFKAWESRAGFMLNLWRPNSLSLFLLLLNYVYMFLSMSFLQIESVSRTNLIMSFRMSSGHPSNELLTSGIDNTGSFQSFSCINGYLCSNTVL